MTNKDNSIAVIMITLNEAHNLKRAFQNIKDWADEIYILDSYSQDETIDLCIDNNVKVIQKKFVNFGDQWNYALNAFDVKSKWVMKLDPDEILSEELKENIKSLTGKNHFDGFYINRRLWFLDKPLPVNQRILRIWKNNSCKFSDSLVNEYPQVSGKLGFCPGELKHFDSPNLEHWLYKQNKYTTSEALAVHRNLNFAAEPKLFGSSLERRMFVKKYFYKLPFRYQILFLYHYLYLGAFKAGKVGWMWSNLRCLVYRITDYKIYELRNLGELSYSIDHGPGEPDSRCEQH